jgi:hypothetical protein
MHDNAPIVDGPIICPNGLVRAQPADYVVKTYWGCGASCPDHNQYHGTMADGRRQMYGITDGGCGCACITVAETNRRKAQAAAKAAAEKAAAEKAAADAAAKAAAKKRWEDAEADAAAKLKAIDDRKTEYKPASNAVPPLQLVYDNAQKAADNAKTKKAEYDDAVAQQTAANVLLTSATNELSKINTKRQENVNKTVGEDSLFLKDAASFPNTTFGTDKEYNAMTADWAAYTAAKTALAATDSKKIVDVTAATDKLVETYNKFVTSKGTYGASVIKILKSNNTDSEYVKNSKNDMDTYGLIYDITKEYNAMMNAWTKVTTSLDKSDVAGVIMNYNAYVPTKTAFTKVLLIAQNKKAEADFQTNLAAGKDAAAKWLTGSAKGCRNIQTIATTDPNMLDQDIACNDTEYISGYNKVSGYDAAPVDPNLSRDNIAQYLAVKYSCCVAPAGAKGTRGKQGLPGLDGILGSIGPVGLAGPAGLVGNKGESGDMGEEGGKGPTGDKGEDGTMGAAGPPGKPGESVKVPYIRQLPGPMGQPGQRGPRGVQGPKGPDGVIKPAPVQPFSEVDRTIGLVNLQERINKYIKGI